MRGASCWTDHKLVKAKLQVNLPRVFRGEKRSLSTSSQTQLGEMSTDAI